MKRFFLLIVISGIIHFSCSSNSTAAAASVAPQNISPAETTGGTGSDMYYEHELSCAGKQFSVHTNTKMYISSKGDMRVEMEVTNSAIPGKNRTRMVIIGHSDKPDESISIDDSAKTYSINRFSDQDLNTGEKIKSTVTKIGEEKILGFNSIHTRIVSVKSISNLFSQTDTIDLWRSTSVPLLPKVKELMEKFETRTGNMMYSADVVSQLKQMGCEGFMTKMEIHSKNAHTLQQLVKAEHLDLNGSMFQVPAGYTEDKGL